MIGYTILGLLYFKRVRKIIKLKNQNCLEGTLFLPVVLSICWPLSLMAEAVYKIRDIIRNKKTKKIEA